MALLHHKSPECTLAPMTRLSIEDKVYTEIMPLSAITENGPIEFFLPGNGEKYLDLNDTLLHLRVKITNAHETDLMNDLWVSIIYPLNTMRRYSGGQINFTV